MRAFGSAVVRDVTVVTGLGYGIGFTAVIFAEHRRRRDGIDGLVNRTEQLLGSAQAGVDVTRCQQSVVADLEELVRQDVQEEAPDEFLWF